MSFCERCGEYNLHSATKDCGCVPFLLIDEDGDEHKQHGINERDAALKYAEESNQNNDYYLMNGSVEITVNGKKFSISAEPDVHYSASELQDQS